MKNTNLQNPLISILITVYNQKNYIQRAIDSVINQTYDNVEIIIGDDASYDGYEFILPKGKHAENLKYIKYPKNIGRVANYRRLLFDEANGDFATILNGDDFFLDNSYIENAVRLIRENNEVALVFGQTSVYLENDKKFFEDKKVSNLPKIVDGNRLLLLQADGYTIPHVSSIFNRKLASDLDFYRSQYMSQDWESLYRIIQGKKVGFISTTSAAYGRHHDNVSKSLDLDYVMKSTEYITNAYDLAIELNQIERRVLDAWKMKMLERYFAKIYLKIVLWDKSKRALFFTKLSALHPNLYKDSLWKMKLKVLDFAARYPSLLIFVFKHILKQEGVVRDFLQYKPKQFKL